MEFQGAEGRRVEARFDAGRVTSDGGLLLLRDVAKGGELFEQLAACFTDHRSQNHVEHRVEQLLAQRILGLALGYEDLNDHESLRLDALLAVAAGKKDPTGENRARKRDRGKALAGKSTLNRLELAPEGSSGNSRYKKIAANGSMIRRLFVTKFQEQYRKPPKRITLDVDPTNDRIHGNQEGRFFHGYYGHYCYLPLYIFCGDALLSAELRLSSIDPVVGAISDIARVVNQIRELWPKVEITVRGDSGFGREELMTWCEQNRVSYVLGLKGNTRLVGFVEDELEMARQGCEKSGEAVRYFKDFRYKTLKTWRRERRVIGKAEHLPGKSNPRFVVTSFPRTRYKAKYLYEKIYCARGEMENRIKEQQLGLFADRTSTHYLWSNQLRLWFSSFAYVLMNDLRRIGLQGTSMARAQVWTIRTRILKLGAVVKVSVRRVYVALSSVYPWQPLFDQVRRNIQRYYPLRI
jgi:hypothetical protein